ncbi:MAG: class I SAM-dependent methyltransferase [Dysgonamonadaceae bacterium]|jgi:2-polyprenyl-3-methyl-5-hydroxy-6-metoxy-1,4-benzoquinol methylase|nr:class I SAM-dependent methyltransferase [Dysgonamonadaceae bacterium]
MDLVKQELWDDSYKDYNTELEINQSNPLVEWIETASSFRKGGNSLEIGVFPGIYTAVFGKLGHEINGIDLTARVTELNQVFRSKGMNVGEFLQKDFFEFKPDKKYDIVFSLGFIEHFTDYKSVIAKHCELVGDNGIILIAVPNFRGKLQYLLHKMVDKENLNKHNLRSMNPKDWENTLVRNGFDIIKQGYIGSFDFWTGLQKRNHFQRALEFFLVHRITPLLSRILSKPSAFYSPYCGIIAQKHKNGQKDTKL